MFNLPASPPLMSCLACYTCIAPDVGPCKTGCSGSCDRTIQTFRRAPKTPSGHFYAPRQYMLAPVIHCSLF